MKGSEGLQFVFFLVEEYPLGRQEIELEKSLAKREILQLKKNKYARRE